MHADDQLAIYDLTRDAWDTHQMLGRVGLMEAIPGEITSSTTDGGHRFRREPHAFNLDDSALQKAALPTMREAVGATRIELLEK